MIDGVQCKPLEVHLDDRGAFMEAPARGRPRSTRALASSNFSITYPGVIKAWHWLQQQDDLWFIVSERAGRPARPARGLADARSDRRLLSGRAEPSSAVHPARRRPRLPRPRPRADGPGVLHNPRLQPGRRIASTLGRPCHRLQLDHGESGEHSHPGRCQDLSTWARSRCTRCAA